MRAPLPLLGKVLLALRVLQWIFAIIIIGTAASAIRGTGYNRALRAIYAALAFASFIVLFHSIWIPLSYLAARRPFQPHLALLLDAILFISLLIIGSFAADSNFVGDCDDRNDQDAPGVPDCSKLVAATVFIFLIAATSLVAGVLNHILHQREYAATGYGKNYDVEAAGAVEHPHTHDHTHYTAANDTFTGVPTTTAAAGGPIAGAAGTAGHHHHHHHQDATAAPVGTTAGVPGGYS